MAKSSIIYYEDNDVLIRNLQKEDAQILTEIASEYYGSGMKFVSHIPIVKMTTNWFSIFRKN